MPPATAGRWSRSGLIVAEVVGLALGLPAVVGLLVLCGSGAASTIAAWFIVPTFIRLRRLLRERDRDRR